MQITRSVYALAAVAALGLMGTSIARAADAAPGSDDVASELKALKARVAELEQKESSDWMTAERTAQIRAIVNDALADAKTRAAR